MEKLTFDAGEKQTECLRESGMEGVSGKVLCELIWKKDGWLWQQER